MNQTKEKAPATSANVTSAKTKDQFKNTTIRSAAQAKIIRKNVMTPEQVRICIKTAEDAIGTKFTPRFCQICEDLGRFGVFETFWEALADTVETEEDQTKWFYAAIDRLRKELAQ